jgi:hypothetical protein
MAECKKCSDRNKWKETIETELNSLKKRKMFIEVTPTPPRTFHVGFNNEVVRYKVRLIAHSFTQRPRVDFYETYSPVMNGITF